MKFRELFEKYKQGKTTQKESDYVEQCMEKYEVLTENYLEEPEDMQTSRTAPLPDAPSTAESQPPTEDLHKLRRAIRRQRTFIVLISGLVTCALLIFGLIYNQYFIELINKTFYNDLLTNTYSEFSTDMTTAFQTYYELHAPDKQVQHVNAKSTGIGNYHLDFIFNDWLGDLDYGQASLTKGKYDINLGLITEPVMNAFSHGVTYMRDPCDPNRKTKVLESLQELPESSYLYTLLSFHDDISMEDLAALIEKYEDCNFKWTAVRNSPDDIQRLPQIGFRPDSSFVHYDQINDYYPNYMMWDIEKNEETMTQHFLSLLQFQMDHDDFLNGLEVSASKEYYEEVLEYIQTSGLYSYGVIVTGYAANILELCQEENICQILIDKTELVVSQY